MMNYGEFWPEIRLLPIEGSTRSPLRRTLARTAWKRSPLALVYYESEKDQLLIQLVDVPTVAEAVPADQDDREWNSMSLGQPATYAEDEGSQFAGFDGTESHAWPTTIAVLGFSRCRDGEAPYVRLVKALCGDHIWTAAGSAVHHPRSGVLEIPIGQDEAEFLIRRWLAILTPPSVTGMTGPAVHGPAAEQTSVDPIHQPHWPGDRATTLHPTASHRGGRSGREP
jgi:hypothetical protein